MRTYGHDELIDAYRN